MLGRTYEGQNCSVAKSLELVGERWTMLVVREVFLGNRRFDEIAARLGIARNVLTARLGRLVDEGVLERVRYQERPERFEYYAPDGPPMVLTHKACGGAVDAHRECDRCGARLTARDVVARPGPGALAPTGS